MGLFDRIRKAFSSQDDEEKIKQEIIDNDEESIKSEENASDSDSNVVSEEKISEDVEQSVDSQEKKDDESEEDSDEILDSNEDNSEFVKEEDSDDSSEQNDNLKVEEEVSIDEEKRYDKGLEKSRKGFGAMINSLLANFRHVDEDFFEELEETLIEADVGFETAMKISDELRQEVKLRNAKKKNEISDAIIEKLVEIYENEGKEEDNNLHFSSEGPTVFLFVGVNGVGKTTTIGKLAHRYKMEGKKVMLAAADTFRAGAIEQLAEWGQRVGVTVVKKVEKSDPAAVVFDAVKKAKEEDYDILLVDTAGRLQNKVNLMKELEKIARVITREIPDAPHEVLLALDATTGQNALTQAKQFKDVTNVTGIVLTKLDGTAKGGIVLAIRNELHLPVKLVGLGEKMDDLRDFSPEEYVVGLFKGLVTPSK